VASLLKASLQQTQWSDVDILVKKGGESDETILQLFDKNENIFLT
jgi:predicted nucleotidyltransferase